MRSASVSAAVVTLDFMEKIEEIKGVLWGGIAFVGNDRCMESVGGVEVTAY